MKSNALEKPNNPIEQHKLSEILTRLMKDAGITDADLGSTLGVSPKTIQSLRLAKDSNPTINTLQPIASYFHIRVDQLLGSEPIKDEEWGVFVRSNAHSMLVPILELHEAGDFKPIVEKLKPGVGPREWVSAPVSLSTYAFAVIAKGSQTSERFPEGCILIFDPEIEKTDRAFVIVLPENKKIPVLRQYINSGVHDYFKNINPEIKDLETYQSYKIIAVMRQYLFNLTHIAK